MSSISSFQLDMRAAAIPVSSVFDRRSRDEQSRDLARPATELRACLNV